MTHTEEAVAEAWLDVVRDLHGDIFNYDLVKPMPADWAERHLWLPDSVTVYPGRFTYDWTPYCREIVNHLHPSSPVRNVAVMKGSQSGLTQGVVVPGICWIIAVNPESILFTAADLTIAARTIAERLDPILRLSKLDHFIRPHSVKKGNNTTGDTKYFKQYAGGTLAALGTSSAESFRYFSCKYAFPDDFETAPRDLGHEGDVTKLIENRQKSHGRKAKTIYISTPVSTATSNIYEQYQKGTMKKWNWWCPSCGSPVMTDFQMKQEDGTMAGLIWELDANKKLIKNSIHFRTPCCGHLFDYSDKYDLNKDGFWVPTTSDPEEEYFESYQLNDIFIPPGFDDWQKIVEEFLKANPPGERAIVRKLRTFVNQRLGMPFEELGDAPKVTDLMQNLGDYKPGVVPDLTCKADGNGEIILITLACDLNGEEDDARLDYEICAHSETTATYSIDHGSIGTFVRTRQRGKLDKPKYENDRDIFTYQHGHENSVWPVLEGIIKTILISESGRERDINLSVVDKGFFSKHVLAFITQMQSEGYKVFGIVGKTDENYRKLQRDSQPVRRSTEAPKRFYIAEVNQIKDDLSQYMRLHEGEDGSQPSGFMNFPQARDHKYEYASYFQHFEGERRIEVKNKNDEVVGYQWTKKNSDSINHFWDVRVYNMCAPLIYLDLVRHSDSKYKQLTWEEFVLMTLS